jgi:predicted PurR-regulated permease PerM
LCHRSAHKVARVNASTNEVDPEIRELRWIRRLLAALLCIVVLYVAVVGAAVVVPILLATLLSVVFAPTVRTLCRWHVPRSLASALVVVVMICGLGALLASLVNPARDWIAKIPRTLDRLSQAAHELLRRPLQAASQATQAWSDLTDTHTGAQAVRVVEAPGPGPLWQVLSAAPGILVSTIATLLLVYIFLRQGDSILLKSVQLAPQWRLKREIVEATRRAQHELSRYMLTITAINFALGAAVAIGLWLLGMANPLLWGGIAALFNFAPYIGPLLALIVFTVAGFGEATSPLAALAVPGVFLLLHIIESWIFTPLFVGRRLALDPVVVFVALLALGAMWGVAGLLLAMPLLTCVRIVAEHVPQFAALAQLLSRNQGTLVYSHNPSVASEISE